jgi:hypothetical protein
MFKKKVKADQAVIVIPVYQDHLSNYERIALQQCIKVLGGYKIIVIKPRSLNLTVFKHYPFIEYRSFNDNCFLDTEAYSSLLMSEKFYAEFTDFKYMLIYQLDAFVFKDELLEWCNKGYDYIGAPWLKDNNYTDVFHYIKSKLRVFFNIRYNIKEPGKEVPARCQFENQVGNGGFSLRRIDKFHHLARQYADHYNHNHLGMDNWLPEDVFWAISINRLKTNLNIPKYQDAIYFAFEHALDRAFSLTDNMLPFGCHAWNLHVPYWREIFKKNGYSI